MKLGKTKTTLQLVSIIVIISLIIFKKFLVQTGQIPESPGPIGIPIQDIVLKYFSNISIFITYTPTFLMFITMVITVFSGLQYIYKNRELFYTHEHKKNRNDVENWHGLKIKKSKHEDSEDGPGNVSSEKWITFERIDKGEAEELKKWNFPR